MAPDAAADRLQVRLVSPAEVRAGETVPVTVRIENVGSGALELYLRGRPVAFDVEVTDAAGVTVWRRLHDAVIPAIIQLRVLSPRDVLELEAEWDQRDDGGGPVAPGDYLVRGRVLTDSADPLDTGPVRLRIVPR